MEKVEAYIIESYGELDKLTRMCAFRACRTCCYKKPCFDRNALWVYHAIIAPTPELVMYKLKKGGGII